ncbi:Zn(2)-C6 fungal-type domain-containing protein [Fusarium falciforme]|uniref:Zn(2)-C6 fungal-type domain-containing protein n=1 Tax=Fusarium falciforme TaxID=195108 RepID=UPI002301686B|nr:Zn(2)-C6 fungal-type domain-containing protein [Fusarium falciforme]WAO91624.1 Zn(2)-C6 fungal-type domain-containing protein [Fusarium falciforme]
MAFTEVLQQRSDKAYLHLRGAAALMVGHGNGSSTAVAHDEGVSTLFEKLDLHTATYVLTRSPDLPSLHLATPHSMPTSPDRTLYRILHACYHFISTARQYKYINSSLVPSNILIEQGRHLGNLQQWLSCHQLDPSRLGADPQNEQLIILRAQSLAGLIHCATVLQPHETSYDSYDREFKEILKLAEALFGMQPEVVNSPGYSGDLPHFAPEMGIIQPLFLTALKYRHPFWRRKALDLLQKSGREGPWCGAIEAAVLKVVIEAEEATPNNLQGMNEPDQAVVYQPSGVPENQRVHLCWIVGYVARQQDNRVGMGVGPGTRANFAKVQLSQTAGFNYSGVSVGVRSIYEDTPFLDFHHTPPSPASKRGTKEVDASTVYRLGSVSKLFTVLAALKLAEDGVLSLDDPVGRWIPELSGRDGDPESEDELDRIEWQDVTVEDVAAHLSGIGGDMTGDLASFDADWEALGLPKASPETKTRACSGNGGIRPCTREDLLEAFQHRRPSVYPPGQVPVYSNAGTSIVGLVVEAASNKTFEASLRNLVLEPLALWDTSVGTVPEKSDRMFIPAGSTDWDMDLGIFAPAGGMNSNTKDLLSFMTGILKNSALFPSSTRRWLKPASFLSAWSSAVGAPWEIYRVDNLTSDGRIIDLYTKGGSLTSYYSALAVVPDLGFVISVLAAGPEVIGLWPSLASLQAMEVLIPALDLAAKDEAKKRFAGTYTDKKSGSRLTLSLDDGPGLALSDWVVRDFEVLPNLGRYNPVTMNATTGSNLTSIRMFPTGIENARRSAWRATFPAFTEEEAKVIDGSTSIRDASCVTWRMVDRLIYNDLSIDHFEFQFGEDGEAAMSIKCKGFDVELTRDSDGSQDYEI